jgi:hypothetical protein
MRGRWRRCSARRRSSRPSGSPGARCSARWHRSRRPCSVPSFGSGIALIALASLACIAVHPPPRHGVLFPLLLAAALRALARVCAVAAQQSSAEFDGDEDQEYEDDEEEWKDDDDGVVDVDAMEDEARRGGENGYAAPCSSSGSREWVHYSGCYSSVLRPHFKVWGDSLIGWVCVSAAPTRRMQFRFVRLPARGVLVCWVGCTVVQLVRRVYKLDGGCSKFGADRIRILHPIFCQIINEIRQIQQKPSRLTSSDPTESAEFVNLRPHAGIDARLSLARRDEIQSWFSRAWLRRTEAGGIQKRTNHAVHFV